MKITPEIIEIKEFKSSINGYNKKEVDIFLDEIIEEFEFLLKEKQKLREEKDILLNQLAHFKNIENELSQTLLKAQESADEIREQAEDDYEKKLQEANLIISNSNSNNDKKTIDLNEKYNLLKKQYVEYKKLIKNIISEQLEFLKKDDIS